METNENVIELHDIRKVYKSSGGVETTALDGIDFSVRSGEFVAIMGASGSGKSSLMNIIGLLDQHYEGEYLLDGHSVRKLKGDQLADIRAQKIGFVFQQFNLLKRATVLQNVLLPTMYAPISNETERALELIRRVGLGARASNKSNQLSGGQIQRVAIARALMMGPSYLLADEPTGNLDTTTSHEIMELFKEINQTHGTTIILITHEREIAAYASRIIRLKDGYIESEDRQ